MLRSIALLATVLILTGCSALKLQSPVSDESIRATSKMGVVSILGDDFKGIKLSSTRFQNEYFTGDVADWSIDKFAVSTAITQLKASHKFSISELDRRSIPFQNINRGAYELLLDTARNQGYDKLMILRPEVLPENRYYAPGYGLVENWVLGEVLFRCTFASFYIEIYNFEKKEITTSMPAYFKHCNKDDKLIIPFKQSFDLYSMEERAILRAQIENRLRNSLVETLRYLLPAPKSSANK